MSRTLRAHVVCEGPTDLVVIEAALRSLIGPKVDLVVVLVQPEESALGRQLAGQQPNAHGAGWKGVRSRAREQQGNWGRFSSGPAMLRADVFIVHLDLDVTTDAEIETSWQCPPPPAEKLESELLGWLGESSRPAKTVLCLPSFDTEAWVLAALHPEILPNDEPECFRSTAEALLAKEKASGLRDKNRMVKRLAKGGFKKRPAIYRQRLEALQAGWPNASQRLAQARAFERQLAEVLES